MDFITYSKSENVEEKKFEEYLKVVDLNEFNNVEETLFYTFCVEGNITPKLISLCFEYGADASIESGDEQVTPLLGIARNKKISIEILEVFKQNKVDFNKTYIGDNNIVSFLAVNENVTVDIFKWIAAQGVDITKECTYGTSILFNVLTNKNLTPGLLRFFLDLETDVNEKIVMVNSRPIHILAMNTGISPELVTMLIDRGAKLNKRNYLKYNALHFLCDNEAVSFDLLKVFIDNGIRTNLKDHKGRTPRDHLLANAHHTEEMLTLFDETPSDIDKVKEAAGGDELHMRDLFQQSVQISSSC